jgi:acetylornithine deacetylase/succinyl-diaminopimelate desuccinylase-like protein
LEIESLLSKLIQIQSVNPPGGETEVARFLKHLFDEYQIPNEIIESAPGRGSFLAYLGEGEKSLLYLSHTDVVPASEGWSFNPFSGEINDGFIHGRGALDCKGLVAAEAFAVLQLASSTRLKGRLIFAATADEEAGGTLGVQYLLENHKDKITADFVVNEGGLAPLRVGDRTCHFTQIGEKGICWMNLKTSGSSAHGSLPMLGDNAVVKMAEVIDKLSKYQPKVTLIPEVRQLVQEVTQLEGFDKDVNEDNVGEAIRRLSDRIFAGYLTAFTKMTVSPNVVHGGAKVNIVPDSCEAEVDIRVLPGQDQEYIVNELCHAIGNTVVEIIQYHAPTFSTADSDYYRLVVDTLQESLGDAVLLPCISSGASDSRFLRESGMPCYGIGIMTLNLDDNMKQSVHGKDEKIDIDSLKLKSDFLVRLARKYLGEQVN